MSDIFQSMARTNAMVDDIASTDQGQAVLTLTRTAVQAITTAGTAIVWQQELRGYEITWTNANITIPSTGWYMIQTSFFFSAALNSCYLILTLNGTNNTRYNMIGDIDSNINSITALQYYQSGDVITITLLPSANVNVNIIAERLFAESPILHIVQISGPVETDAD